MHISGLCAPWSWLRCRHRQLLPAGQLAFTAATVQSGAAWRGIRGALPSWTGRVRGILDSKARATFRALRNFEGTVSGDQGE